MVALLNGSRSAAAPKREVVTTPDDRQVHHESLRMGPGDTVTTSVLVSNPGRTGAEFSLDVDDVTSTRDPAIDEQLLVIVSNRDGTVATSGHPSELLALPATLEAGGQEEFTVTFDWPEAPEDGEGSTAVNVASMSATAVTLRWGWVLDTSRSGAIRAEAATELQVVSTTAPAVPA
jgi:hypothetical protein